MSTSTLKILIDYPHSDQRDGAEFSLFLGEGLAAAAHRIAKERGAVVWVRVQAEHLHDAPMVTIPEEKP